MCGLERCRELWFVQRTNLSTIFQPNKRVPSSLLQSKPKAKKTPASFDPPVYVQGKKALIVPVIYHSPPMKCLFTTGSVDIETSEYEPAKLPKTKKGGLWCGPESGVNPWHMAQRLAAEPRQMKNHYTNVKFSKLANVNPDGACLESFSGGCTICNPDSTDPQPNACSKPRTWVIGQRLHFANPKSRNIEIVQSNRVRLEQVAPAPTVETKTK